MLPEVFDKIWKVRYIWTVREPRSIILTISAGDRVATSMLSIPRADALLIQMLLLIARFQMPYSFKCPCSRSRCAQLPQLITGRWTTLSTSPFAMLTSSYDPSLHYYLSTIVCPLRLGHTSFYSSPLIILWSPVLAAETRGSLSVFKRREPQIIPSWSAQAVLVVLRPTKASPRKVISLSERFSFAFLRTSAIRTQSPLSSRTCRFPPGKTALRSSCIQGINGLQYVEKLSLISFSNPSSSSTSPIFNFASSSVAFQFQSSKSFTIRLL